MNAEVEVELKEKELALKREAIAAQVERNGS